MTAAKTVPSPWAVRRPASGSPVVRIGQMTNLAPTLAAVLLTAPAMADVIPFETVAGYKIAHVTSADVCFAVSNLKSEKGLDMAYSYYRKKSGQRWQVAGYLSALDHPATTDELTIDFDGDDKLTRTVEFRDGDFMVPFEALAELQAFEADVEAGEILTYELTDDAFSLPLSNLRAAIDGVIRCLETEK